MRNFLYRRRLDVDKSPKERFFRSFLHFFGTFFAVGLDKRQNGCYNVFNIEKAFLYFAKQRNYIPLANKQRALDEISERSLDFYSIYIIKKIARFIGLLLF